MNLAEVSLHFENEDGALPVAFQEVVITRRLSRSGESDYFLNRAPCRLRECPIDHRCMRRVTIDRVLGEVEALLGA